MFKIKKIIEKFEVSRGTLHNWKTTKPNLYNYLLNFDEKYEKYREVNIFLDTYIKTAQTKIFTYHEIEYIFDLELHLKTITDMQNMHLIFINTSAKSIKENTTFTLDIYKKLETLNLIEKYIFCETLNLLAQKIKAKKEEKKELLTHYFKEFLV
ncbi:MAG: hypothetical protein Q7S59_03035 [Sulfurimonas sp.]|nr:hypothetical protein [Sulfurimonas sp.]